MRKIKFKLIWFLIGLILSLWIIYCFAEEKVDYQEEFFKQQYEKEKTMVFQKEDKAIAEFLDYIIYPCGIYGLTSQQFVPYFRILYNEQKEIYKGDFIDFIFDKLNQRIANIDGMEIILRKLIQYENQSQ